VLLTDDVGERAGPVAAIERGTGGHGQPSLVTPAVVRSMRLAGPAPIGGAASAVRRKRHTGSTGADQ
jgi:hypothetical protein